MRVSLGCGLIEQTGLAYLPVLGFVDLGRG